MLALLLLISARLYANNLYVSIETGKSNNAGTTPAKPKKQIQEAADLAKPGDTVFVMNGIYTNPCGNCDVVSIKRSGKKSKYITYTNYPGQRPVIHFTGWAGIAIKSGTSYINVNGFEVIGNNASVKLSKALTQPQSCNNKKGSFDPQYNGNGIVVEGLGKKHSHHIIIANNLVHDCGGGGIGATHADYITIDGNIVYNTSLYTVFGTSGISLYQFWNYDKARGYHNVIRKNKCFNNRSLVPWINNCEISDGNGIIIDDFRNKQNGSKLGNYEGRTLIENNISWYNGGTGIHTFQSDHVDIINNTAYCNSRSKGLNAGQILSGLSNDNKIINNLLVSDSSVMINSNFSNTNLTYENNLHYNITYPGKEKISITSPSCINGEDPAFVNPGNKLTADFKLKKNSPAVQHGNRNIFTKTNFDGDRLPTNLAPNIGAY